MLLEITINGGNKIHIKRTQSLPGDPKNSRVFLRNWKKYDILA
jgi:hypothetical protein